MEMTLTEFVADAKAKIDLLAMAIDSATHGITADSHPRAQANIALADKKLAKLRNFLQRIAIAAPFETKPEDIAVFKEFLEREIAGAQSYLSGASEKVSSDRNWTIGLAFLAAAIIVFLLTRI